MLVEKRWQQSFADYKKAVNRLQKSLDQGSFNELEKDGVVQRFEFTFELAWKTLKKYLEDQGFSEIASPKKVIQKSFENNLFSNSDFWIEMLDDRNRMSHMYDQEASEEIFQNIKDKYFPELKKIIKTLE